MLRRLDWHLPAILFGCLVAIGVAGALLYFLVTRETPAPGGTYIEGIAGSPSALNPLLASFNDTDRDITALIFSGLTRLGADGTVLPDLAREWTVDESGKTYTFVLRDDARWHDGQRVTVDDVLFTIGMLQDKDLQGNPELAALWRKVKARAASDDSVRLTLEQPFAPFLSYTSIGIVPKHLLGPVAPKDMAGASFNAAPVGSGPFRLSEASLEQVGLGAYLDSYGGRPFLDRIQFKFLPDDQALAAALTTRQVDGGLLRPSVGKEAIDRVRAVPGMAVSNAPRASYSLLLLNTRSPLFKDKSVRQALAYSIDAQKLVDEAVGGQGVPAEGPIASASWAYDESVSHYDYDPNKASQLLEQEGWKINGSGLREKESQALKFNLLTNDDKLRIATGQEIARQLKPLGVQADVAASGVTGLFQNFLLPRKFDAVLYGIDPGYDPDPYPLWHSSQATGDGLNLSVFSQPEVDALLEKARTSTSVDERRELYRQFQVAFAEDLPSIPLYHPLYAYALPQSVKGVNLGLFYETSSRFLNVKEWYKETKRTFRS